MRGWVESFCRWLGWPGVGCLFAGGVLLCVGGVTGGPILVWGSCLSLAGWAFSTVNHWVEGRETALNTATWLLGLIGYLAAHAHFIFMVFASLGLWPWGLLAGVVWLTILVVGIKRQIPWAIGLMVEDIQDDAR